MRLPLHHDVEEIYRMEGRKVVLIAHSMGAAIVRGFLAYSKERRDGVWSMVDSVVFLEGAQDGSYLAGPAGFGLDAAAFVSQISWVSEVAPARPALHDLTPQSPWYSWTNPSADHLPALPYYNVYGGLVVTTNLCLIFADWCWEAGRGEWGDFVMKEGTDDPHDLPDTGGARFLDGDSSSSNWQWGLNRTYAAYGVIHVPDAVLDALSDPIMHVNFGGQLDEIETQDCSTGATVSLDAALLTVIRDRMDEGAASCQP
jgi:pimeloyl-ACP methyl ester carboxylesterase